MSQDDLGDFTNLDNPTVVRYLRGVGFPADKEDVASAAEKNGAPRELVRRIRNAGRERFDGPDEVMQEAQGR
jgi:hypothetical protein